MAEFETQQRQAPIGVSVHEPRSEQDESKNRTATGAIRR
jgi:hypothetical protein